MRAAMVCNIWPIGILFCHTNCLLVRRKVMQDTIKNCCQSYWCVFLCPELESKPYDTYNVHYLLSFFTHQYVLFESFLHLCSSIQIWSVRTEHFNPSRKFFFTVCLLICLLRPLLNNFGHQLRSNFQCNMPVLLVRYGKLLSLHHCPYFFYWLRQYRET